MEGERPSRFLRLSMPDEALLMGVAEEGALSDVDLDAIEASLDEGTLEPEESAALALVLGRAGRPSSADALRRLHGGLERSGSVALSAAALLALDLLAAPPRGRVERAEAGYRFTDPRDGAHVYVEDGLAAYWHRRGVWGPPVRPRVEARDREASGSGALEEWLSEVLDGRLVRVDFRPGPLDGRLLRVPGARRLFERDRLQRWAARVGLREAWTGSEGPLYVMRAGISRDRALATLVRWPDIRSLGLVEGRLRRRIGFERRDGRLEVLPAGPSVPADELLALLRAVADRARRAGRSLS